MTSLELNSEELSLLDRTLQWRLTMLLTEINHTDTRDFRADLRRQATEVEHLLERLHKTASRRAV